MDLKASSTKVYINHSQENQKHFNPTTPEPRRLEPRTTDNECFSFFFLTEAMQGKETPIAKRRIILGKGAECQSA